MFWRSRPKAPTESREAKLAARMRVYARHLSGIQYDYGTADPGLSEFELRELLREAADLVERRASPAPGEENRG